MQTLRELELEHRLISIELSNSQALEYQHRVEIWNGISNDNVTPDDIWKAAQAYTDASVHSYELKQQLLEIDAKIERKKNSFWHMIKE